MHVLVLEDDIMARELLKTVLYGLNMNIDVLEAETYAQGRALFQQHQPTLVLCDWTLADQDNGLALVKFIRQQDADTPILMISGRSDRQTVVSSRQQGVTEFFRKPFDPIILGDRLKSYLEKQAAAEAPEKPELPAVSSWLQDIKARMTPPPTLGGTRDIVTQLNASEPPSVQDLAKRWRSSQAITIRLINVANSGMFKRYGKSVNNLIDAINSMGVTMALQQALALSLDQRDQLSHPALAQLSILRCQEAEKIAATAATLAKQKQVNLAQSYTAGLLYPLGDLALLQLMQSYLDQGGELNNAEMETMLEKLGWKYHQALQQLWKLPQELRDRFAAAHELADEEERPELVLMSVAVDRVKGNTENDDYQRKLGMLGLAGEAQS
ncbi:response regulator [Saccharospirillum mangrovi]|uniref:response regulator n=1 Tax=Saccharospirillum mangrovi TaxID=2161747 RepID=UPI000D38942C|nr:response regulator [Saccharospirillum mangrovi]